MSFRQTVFIQLLFSALCGFPVPPAGCEQEPASEPAALFPYVGLVTGSGVNLRSGPGRSYEILLQLARGSELRVLERRQDWFAVSLPETVPAYIYRAYLGLPGPEGWAGVKGEHVQVRVRPSESATSWGEISSPERVRVLGTHGDWVQVQPPSFCRGWVSAEYLAFLQEEEVMG